MNHLQQVMLGLVLALALSSYVSALTPKHVLDDVRDDGESVNFIKIFDLKTIPETAFEYSRPQDNERFRAAFRNVALRPEFTETYPCRDPLAANLLSFRYSTRTGIWTRITYRVIIELPQNRQDMIFVEILEIGIAPLSTAYLMGIRNGVSINDNLPLSVEHKINNCPGPDPPFFKASGWTDK